MNNDKTKQSQDLDDENKTTERFKSQTEDDPKPAEEEVKPVDGEKVVEKLQKRLGKEQAEKNDYADRLKKAETRIKELESGKDVKKLSEEDKVAKAESEKDKQIAMLKAQLERNEAIKQTDGVFKEAGLKVDDGVLNMVVANNDDQTYANAKALIAFANQVQEETRNQYLKGRTPRINGKPTKTMSREEILAIKDPFDRKKAIAENIQEFQ
ncbi:DUF4355 domain-containing protein [Agrilactobacillus fermenti]|uniref:capsid assembly scaffolding protein Gp46 family protein n=1 Tax=Agrilactobacillus fermenti TaxID=2586909 RepID=UPI001E535A8A|nr:DUF4355 domain-containing protein [Agrilactobacillus fermenti]MCD2256417.1 DUF4355 domain-containing protein [Agrilactobacillus fermenti]